MRYPLGLVLDSARHLAARKLFGDGKCAVMLSLEPLGSGCGSSENGATLSAEQCVTALNECHTPIVVLCGREPLEHPEIATISREILQRKRHLFLSTDGSQIRRHLHMIPPYTNFFWNVRLDGTRDVHDKRLQRTGLFTEAIDGIKAAKNAGFFVIVTTTIYCDTDAEDVANLYKLLHAMHVDGYVLTPHYPSEKLCRDGSAQFREKMHQRFRETCQRVSSYNLMMSPIYLEYLRGERELDCSAWGSPVYGPKGWCEPCSKHNVRFAKTYQELLEKTPWENYGRGMNPRCENCQCFDGYEPAALLGVNPKAGDLWKLLAWQLSGSMGERRNGNAR